MRSTGTARSFVLRAAPSLQTTLGSIFPGLRGNVRGRIERHPTFHSRCVIHCRCVIRSRLRPRIHHRTAWPKIRTFGKRGRFTLNHKRHTLCPKPYFIGHHRNRIRRPLESLHFRKLHHRASRVPTNCHVERSALGSPQQFLSAHR